MVQNAAIIIEQLLSSSSKDFKFTSTLPNSNNSNTFNKEKSLTFKKSNISATNNYTFTNNNAINNHNK